MQKEIAQRIGIDLGLPVLSVKQMLNNVSELAGQSKEFDHDFFHRVKELVDAGDQDRITQERVALKLLRINEYAQDGFILTDYP